MLYGGKTVEYIYRHPGPGQAKAVIVDASQALGALKRVAYRRHEKYRVGATQNVKRKRKRQSRECDSSAMGVFSDPMLP
jgi:hypothetical protein